MQGNITVVRDSLSKEILSFPSDLSSSSIFFTVIFYLLKRKRVRVTFKNHVHNFDPFRRFSDVRPRGTRVARLFTYPCLQHPCRRNEVQRHAARREAMVENAKRPKGKIDGEQPVAQLSPAFNPLPSGLGYLG